MYVINYNPFFSPRKHVYKKQAKQKEKQTLCQVFFLPTPHFTEKGPFGQFNYL